MRYPRTVTLHARGATSSDSLGNEIDASTDVKSSAEIQTRSSIDASTGRAGMTTDLLVILPPTVDVTGFDRLTLDDGRLCDIVGAPDLLHHPWRGGPDHWELTARHVQKAGE